MTPASLMIFAGALAVAVAAPGPSIAALVARVLSRGGRDVIPFIAAMWLGDVIWLTLTVWGLAAIAQTVGIVIDIIRWLGAGYLAFLAWKMWHAPTDHVTGALPPPAPPWRMFGAGLAITLGNPKISLFYIALLPTIIDLTHVTPEGWAELTATMTVVLVSLLLGWVALATRARRLLANPRAMRRTNRGSALVMAAAASFVALKG